jgi:hypothetical protein
MSASVLCVTFDRHDPVRVGAFWAETLTYDMHRGAEEFGEIALSDPTGTGPDIYLMTVPESKVVKNRVHLDLQAEPTMEAEVARLEAAGASVLATHQDPEGFVDPYIWTVMKDPEGNEFCVGEPLSRRG